MNSKGQSDALFHGTGSVEFISKAQVETIKAASNELRGILNLTENTFAFSFNVSSFEGFNSPLQKEHFNEHYLETALYPKSTFTGKLIGYEGCEENCKIEVIAKGKFTIHGITKLVSIPVVLEVFDDEIKTLVNFDVVLADYNIGIPIILEAKISPIIQVTVDAKFAAENE